MTTTKTALLSGYSVDLHAGIPVKDYAAALAWYKRLFGPPTFFATDTEAVWELADHRWVFIVQRPEHAGHAIPTIIVDNLDVLIPEIAKRGLKPTESETYSGGWRKVIYHDPDGNEIGFGGGPSET